MQRSRDWLDQAKRDLEHARQSVGLGHFEWVCFASQQAAEKALKALHLHQGTVAWGHSVFELLDGLPERQRPTTDLLDKAKRLDRFYIPPRYANAHPSGPPYRYYTHADADQAVAIAEEVVTYCERQIFQAGQAEG
jgi:HEPN domain-containing protein